MKTWTRNAFDEVVKASRQVLLNKDCLHQLHYKMDLVWYVEKMAPLLLDFVQTLQGKEACTSRGCGLGSGTKHRSTPGPMADPRDSTAANSPLGPVRWRNLQEVVSSSHSVFLLSSLTGLRSIVCPHIPYSPIRSFSRLRNSAFLYTLPFLGTLFETYRTASQLRPVTIT